MKKNICVVPGCTSTDASNDSLKFHQIPKDAEVRKKWLKAINRTEPEINKKSRVCSKHFKNHDYAVTRFNYMGGGKNMPSGSKNTCEFKALKNEAVPNQSLPQKSTFKIKISKKDSGKQIKVEEVKVKEEKVEKPEKIEKVKMPKRPAVEMSPPRSRTQSRRAASKEALKQMQLLLDDENDAVEIPDDDYFLDVIPIDPSPPPPPKKKYKLSHRKSSDGNDRDVIVLKTITNRDAENTLELDCWVEQLEDVQKNRMQKYQDEEKELQDKLDSLISQCSGKVIHKGDLNTIIEVAEQVQSAIQGTQAAPTSLILNNNNLGGQQSYQLVMDPRVGLVVGSVSPQGAAGSQPKVYQGKVQVAQNLQQSPIPSPSVTPARTNARTRNRGGSNKMTPPIAPPPTAVTQPRTPVVQTRAQGTSQTRAQVSPQTRTQVTSQARAQATTLTRQAAPRAQVTPPQTRGQAVAQTRAVQGKKQTAGPATVNTRGRALPATTFTTTVRPEETNVQGGLATGGGKKVVVDLTTEDSNRSAPDSREIAFNKLQGKTYPSLVVVARPHLRVQDLSVDRPKLDAKVKSVLMHAPTKFTEWLIQQGLIRSEQKCSAHTNTQLKLGMYSDVSKFPYSGGYVWISECCPQRFVSVFSGSLFEGSPHPPMVILKLLYHWSCQTNIQNVTQWVKVDNLYVKGMFTWLRSICTVALHTHIRQIGGPGVKVEVGVISLGTTSQDGNQRQVKVEVLGVLESESKLIRLRAVEPQAEGDRNYKKRFSKILEPVCRWVHPQSILVADLTVDKQTLIGMGFQNVVQYSSNQYGNNNQIMEYLRRIVPRMFQNTLSLLSRQIIQQFLDELVWREWFGTSSLQAFDNLVTHLSEQTRFDSGQSLIVRLNKVAQNPFKSWAVNVNNPTKVVETAPTTNVAATTNKKQRSTRKPEPPKVNQTVPQEARPPKSTSPDVPEHMVPLESYYYGTIDTYSKTPKITLNMKCPFCKSTFDNNIQLMSHLFKHAHNVSMDAQLCRYCLTSVATANDLLKHIATSHPAETKFDNGFCCLICETQYMNPFVLGKHMSKEHYPSELPYQCGTCSYRCSNHKHAIDHFYKTHDNGPTIQCPFCLKSTTVFTASRNIVQNMNYFIQHLQKHQRKQFARRCGKCNLWFVQKDVLKDHQNKMHVSQRGKTGLVPWTAPRNGVMVPKSKMDKYPVDAEVINFAALKFDFSKGLMCKECNTPMDTPKHFPSFESCQNPNCQYSTCCTNAMQEHNAKCSKISSSSSEEQLPFEMFCICSYSSKDGNQMARHLAICERKSAYPSRTGAKGATVTHSMLDVLGLVRKSEEKPKQKSKRSKKEVSFENVDKVIPNNEATEKSKKEDKAAVGKTIGSGVKNDNKMEVEEGETNQSVEATPKDASEEEVKDKQEDIMEVSETEPEQKEEEKNPIEKTEEKMEDKENDVVITKEGKGDAEQPNKENIEVASKDLTDEEKDKSVKDDEIEESLEEKQDKMDVTNEKSNEIESEDKEPNHFDDLEEVQKETEIDEPTETKVGDVQIESDLEDSKEKEREVQSLEGEKDSENYEDKDSEVELTEKKTEDEVKELEDADRKETEQLEDEEQSQPQLEDFEDKEGEVKSPEKEAEELDDDEKESEPQIEDSEDKEGDVKSPEKEVEELDDEKESEPLIDDSEPLLDDAEPLLDDAEPLLEDSEKHLEDSEDKVVEFPEKEAEEPEEDEIEAEPQSEDTEDKQLVAESSEDAAKQLEHSEYKEHELGSPQTEPEQLDESEKVQEDSEKIPDDLERVSDDLERVSDDLERVSDDSEKIPDKLEPVVDEPESGFQNHVSEIENTMETAEIPEKGPAITSDDIQNLLSDVVGEKDETSVMETDGDGKQTDDVNMASPTEMMDVPDVGGEAPTPMETD